VEAEIEEEAKLLKNPHGSERSANTSSWNNRSRKKWDSECRSRHFSRVLTG
jgi:hypothetical protein